jgi:N-acetylglucosamine malate deacetylase 1
MQVRRLLALSTHSDDSEIGAGGTIARVLRAGGAAHIAVLSSLDKARMAEAEAGGAALGGATVEGYPRATEWLDGTPLGPLVTYIEGLVVAHRPDAVLLPDPASAHQEHRVVAQAALAALRPTGGTGAHRPPIVAVYEQPADVWRLTDPQHPTWFVSLHPTELDRKVAAVEAHASQARPWPSERSPDALRHLAKLRGSQAGVDTAEALTLLRWLV